MNNSKEQRARRIAALLAGYIRDTLTPAEHDELDEWVGASDRNMRLFEELTDEKRIQLALELLNDNSEAGVLKELQQDDSIVYLKKPFLQRVNHYVVAASLLLVTGAAIFFIVNSNTKQKSDTILVADTGKQEVVPGSNKATLKLADGTIIDLGTISNGQIATQGSSIITKQNDAIQYSIALGQVQNTQINNSLITPKGGKYPVTLSDGSKLWLNAASSVSFPAVFTGNERRISVSGEVYFEVASAKIPGPNFHKPFIVEVTDKNMTVEVLGTHFNLTAYADDPIIKTTLVEGLVKIAAGNVEKLLSPGEQAQVSAEGDIKVISGINTESIIARKDGILQTKDNDLGSVMRDLGRWYNVEIVFEDTRAATLTLSTTLNLGNNISTNLAAIESYLKNVKFTVNERKVFIKVL
jgi:transmembrane sensor